jgi:antirestriction protein ArdC
MKQQEVFQPTLAGQTKQMLDGAVEKLMSALDAGKSDQLKVYLAAMGKFHSYSLGNAILIVLQRPEATHVAGYRTWKSLGRQVRKGEKGIVIMAPIVRRGDGEKEEDEVVAFRTVHIFDLSQTDGQPLAEPAKIAGDPSAYFPRLKGFLEARGIELCYSAATGRAQGLSCGGKIILRPGMEPAEEFGTLVHELAHEMLHRRSSGDKETSRTVRESEAESVAFVVSQAVGLEYNSAGSDYILTYGGDREMLMASLTRIQETAREIIDAVMPASEAIVVGRDSTGSAEAKAAA